MQARYLGNKRIENEPALSGSKSISNRALILASFCPAKTRLTNFLFSDDTVALIGAFRTLGFPVETDESARICTITGGKTLPKYAELNVGNAGTAMRFLASYLTLGSGEFILDGDERMQQRPISDLIEALQRLGVDAECVNGNGCPPVRIRANGVKGGECRIAGANSSQYISSALMAAARTQTGMTIRVEGEAASKPYIDMTIAMMQRFGVKTERDGYGRFEICRQEYRSPGEYAVEPDASAASYFLAGVAIQGGETTIRGLGSESIQGDTRFADVLERMGCGVEWSSDSVTIRSEGKLKGIDIDMNATPDMVMTLCTVALFAEGKTTIRNVGNLRIKESDRISAMATELRKLGAEVEEWTDGLAVTPSGKYRSASIATYNDHRIAMSFAVAGLRIEGVEIENPQCVNKTFPEFFEVWERFTG